MLSKPREFLYVCKDVLSRNLASPAVLVVPARSCLVRQHLLLPNHVVNGWHIIGAGSHQPVNFLLISVTKSINQSVNHSVKSVHQRYLGESHVVCHKHCNDWLLSFSIYSIARILSRSDLVYQIPYAQILSHSNCGFILRQLDVSNTFNLLIINPAGLSLSFFVR